MSHKLKILHIEDSLSDAELIRHCLKKSSLNCEIRVIQTKEEFITALADFNPDVILSDHSLPAFNSMEALRIAKENKLDIPFILVSGMVSEGFALECLKAGADDYVLKSSLMRLPSSIINNFSQKKIKREKKIIESLHTELEIAYQKIEEKNKAITDSINYAKLLQEAVLPEPNELERFFPQSFIINKPKDIVSGDFFWYAEIEQKIFLAVVDCTGHGVAGAFMSILGHNLLDKIVVDRQIHDPGKILNTLDEEVRQSLKQDKKNSIINNGMDIALCCFDKKQKIVEFGGAGIPMLVSKNENLNLITGQRYGIGGNILGGEKKFTTIKTSFDDIDTLYMSTDGYADQFGGKENKKLKRKNFMKLIKFFNRLNIKKKKEALSKFITKWKGEIEQTDDILIIGVQLSPPKTIEKIYKQQTTQNPLETVQKEMLLKMLEEN